MENTVKVNIGTVLYQPENDGDTVDFFGLLVPELRDLLLEYLSSERRVLLKMALVCKKWNKIIINSRNFTSQYLFTNNFLCTIPDETKRTDFLTHMLASRRHYDSMKINRSFMIELVEQVPVKCWRYAELQSLIFKDKVRVINFLNKLSPTMEEISLKLIDIIDSDNPLNDFQSDNEPEFKELRKLKMCLIPRVILRLFVKHHPKLKSLEIGKFMPFTDAILHLLRLNPQIEEFTVNDEIYNLTMTQEMEFLNLRLKSLTIKIDPYHYEPMEPQYHCYQSVIRSSNFMKFIVSQGATLKIFACYNVTEMPTMIFELWNHLTELKELVIDNPSWESSYRLPYILSPININRKLEDLTVAIHFDNQVEMLYFEEMFSKAPNTKILYVRQLHKQLVTFIAYHLKHLKTLKCLLAEDGIEVYEQLKQAPGDINRGIKIEPEKSFL